MTFTEIFSNVVEVQVISPYLLRVSKIYDLKTNGCHCILREGGRGGEGVLKPR